MNCWTSKLFIHRKKRTFTFPSPTLLITGWHQESCLLNNYLRKKRRRNKGLLGCESSCLCLFVAIWHWVNFFKKYFIAVLLQLSQLSPLCPPLPSPPPPHSQFSHCCPCPWVIYSCSLTGSFPFFPPLSPSCLPSGHCQTIHVSMPLVLLCLFVFVL